MKKSKNNGITLVALVVTIIILLILAGVAISALTQTGLFENAKQAKERYEKVGSEENQVLANYSEQINNFNSVVSNRENNNTNNKLLWSGNYDTSVNSNEKQISGGCILNDNNNIEDYNFILIVSAAYGNEAIVPNYYSTIFPVDIIKQNYGYPLIDTSTYVNANISSRFDIGFINKNTFYIAWKSNLSSTWNHQYISHIYGIK